MKDINFKRLLFYTIIISIFCHWDGIGYIHIGPTPVTTIPILIAPILAYENKWSSAIVISIIWATNSWIKPLYDSHGEVGELFINPLLSFLPRLLTGIIGFALIRVSVEKSRKLDFTKSIKWANIISVIMFIMLTFVAIRLSDGMNQNYEVVFIMTFLLLGVFLSMYMHGVIKKNLLSGWLFTIGFFSGLAISILHTVFVLVFIKLVVIGNESLVNEIISYSISTTSPSEIALTTFFTMVTVPIMVNLKPKLTGL